MKPTFVELIQDKKKSPNTQIEYLASLKAARVEGMIIEHEAESAFFTSLANIGWRRFTPPVLFCGGYIDGQYKQWFTIVYHSASHDHDCVIVRKALAGTGFPVRLLDTRGDNPKYRHTPEGTKLPKPQTLEFSEAKEASDDVRDWARVNSVFWGYAVHNPGLLTRFISETLLKDHFVSEGTNSKGNPRIFVSDMDALLIGPNDEIAAIEIKHKRSDRSGSIGLNKAPKDMASGLIKAGMRFIYLVLEKPSSNPESTMYLYFDRKNREAADWIGRSIIGSDLKGELKRAPAHTNIGGRGGVSHVSIPVTSFSLLGKNYESSSVLQSAFAKLLFEGNTE